MPLVLTDDTTLTAGTMTDDRVIVAAAPSATVVNAGLIHPDDTASDPAVTLASGSGVFRNLGTVLHQNSGAALRVGTAQIDVINTGQIAWLSHAGGIGIDLASPAPLENSGTLTAASAAGQATGITATKGLIFENRGHMETHGSLAPVALDVTASGPVEIINTGSVHAVLADVTLTDMGFTSAARAPGATDVSTAIRLTYDPVQTATILIQNHGEIIANRALEAIGTTAGPVRIENSGLLSGQMLLGAADETIVNTGLMDGSTHLGAGDDHFNGGMGTITGPLFGGDGHDTLTIGSFAVPVYGGAGNDVLTGAGDIDVLSGGAGDDVLDGGVNINRLHGGDGDDVLHANSAGHEDFYGGSGADIFIGSLTDLHLDRIHDLDTTDRIRIDGAVLDPDDVDLTKAGRDTRLSIGSETEIYLTGRAKKVIVTTGETYTDIAVVKAPKLKSLWEIGTDNADTLTGLKGDDRLEGLWGDDALYGEKGADTLHGGAGNDLLDGGKHNDALSGEAGNDILTGGKGFDTFIFTSGHDRITDFRPGRDQIGVLGWDLDREQLQTLAALNTDGDLVFVFSAHDSLTLEGVAASFLPDGDIFFG